MEVAGFNCFTDRLQQQWTITILKQPQKAKAYIAKSLAKKQMSIVLNTAAKTGEKGEKKLANKIF